MPLEDVREKPFRSLAETGKTEFLLTAFWWSSSPEGNGYWSQEYDRRGGKLSPKAWEKVRLMYVEWVVCDRDRNHAQD